jgi:hypothetical protein
MKQCQDGSTCMRKEEFIMYVINLLLITWCVCSVGCYLFSTHMHADAAICMHVCMSVCLWLPELAYFT